MKFLGKNYSVEQIEQLKSHLSFENMKSKFIWSWKRKNLISSNFQENDNVNRWEKIPKNKPDKTAFMRKGIVGGYKDEMPKEYIKKFDEWIAKSLEGREHRFNLSWLTINY